MPQNVLVTLKDKTDDELVGLVKSEANSEAFTEICKKYENIFYKICHRYANALSLSGLDVKDIFDEKNCIIFHCVSTFKKSKKTKLSTYIGNYARYLCLNSINKRRFILPSNDDEVKSKLEDSRVSHNYSIETDNLQENCKYARNIIEHFKDPRIAEIFKLRYFGDKKMIWIQIAKKMNISTQTAINLHNKGMNFIKTKMTSKNISDVI